MSDNPIGFAIALIIAISCLWFGGFLAGERWASDACEDQRVQVEVLSEELMP